MIEIKHTSRQVIQEKWEVIIYPEWGRPTDADPTGKESLQESACLVRDCTKEDVAEWVNRSSLLLVDDVKTFLNTRTHVLDIDRGDWGEGTEHFHISFFKKKDYLDFMKLCKKLKDSENGNVA